MSSRQQAQFDLVSIREKPQLCYQAAGWFSDKWGIKQQAYLDCMKACLANEVPYDWFLCLEENRIIGGLGIIENDFHNRPDLSPNVCAVYVEPAYRNRGIAGRLLDLAVDRMRKKAITPLYLLTGHQGFYERYGWQFLTMVQGDGDQQPSRMYVHY